MESTITPSPTVLPRNPIASTARHKISNATNGKTVSPHPKKITPTSLLEEMIANCLRVGDGLGEKGWGGNGSAVSGVLIEE